MATTVASNNKNNKRDVEAAMIGSALKKSTKLGTLDICVTGLTMQGARELAQGIRQSKLTAISFSGQAQDHAQVMGILYRDGIIPTKTIQGLNMVASVGDAEAFLDAMSSVQRLKLWSHSLDRETTLKIARGLASNTSVKEMYLFFEKQDYEMMALLVSSLAERVEGLNKLHIRGERETFMYSSNAAPPNTNNKDDVAALLLRALTKMIESGKAPAELEIVNCQLPQEPWVGLCKALEYSTTATTTCQLASLSITSCTLTPTHAQCLGDSLKHHHNTSSSSSLKALRLVRNQLGDAGLKSLSHGLAYNTSIHTLEIANNKIGDDGIVSLAKTFQPESAIRQLELTHNTIGPVGVQALIMSTSSLVQLQHVNLASNQSMGLEGLKQIGKCLPHLRLKSLDLSLPPAWEERPTPTKGLCHAAATTTQKLLLEKAACALVTGLEENYYMKDLVLTGWHLSSKHLQQVQLYTELNQRGRRSLATEHSLPPALWCHMLANMSSSLSSASSCQGSPPRKPTTDNNSLVHYMLLQVPELFQKSY